MEDQYGFSNEIFELIEPHPTRKRDEDKVGIGYGQNLSFAPYNERSAEWNVIRKDNNSQKLPFIDSYSFRDIIMLFGNLRDGGGIIATLKKSFTLNDKHKNIPLSVTFSFGMIFSNITKEDTGNVAAILPGGLILHYAKDKTGEYESFGKYYYIDPQGDPDNWLYMGDSQNNISFNPPTRVRVVMVIQEGNLKLWENEMPIFEQKITSHDDVQARFGVQYFGENAHGYGNLNILNFQALVGLTQPYVSRTKAIPIPPTDSQRDKMKELADYARKNDLHGKASGI